MLGRSSRESGVLTRAAAQLGGWDSEDIDLLDLGSLTATLSTISGIDDLGAVIHIGHPAQPLPEVGQALLESAFGIVITDAVAVPPEWVLVGPRPGASGAVVVDEAGMRDTRRVLRSLGLAPRLVGTATSVAERIAMAGPDGTLVIERSRVPAGWVELAGSPRLAGEPLWYGLARVRREVTFQARSQVWLAFGPSDDHLGSLGQTLGVIRDHGVDLNHLRSQRTASGPHAFYTSFQLDNDGALAPLLAQLDERGVRNRVLAAIPGTGFQPGPQTVTPQWAPGYATPGELL